ncbi:MAG: long-chain fatty acid--CoA ligase [Solirubrobacterales bacterium]|nr:long-chain fatty acid--CoA ligase [Solirubrobacterales bacterium]
MAKTIAINPSWYWPDDVPRLLGVPPMFCDKLMAERWSRRRSDATAVADADSAVTYAEFWSRAQAVAAALRERSSGEECVALVGPGGVDGLVALIGTLAARRRSILLDPRSEAAGEAATAVGAHLAIVQPPAQAPDGIAAVELRELEEAGADGADALAQDDAGAVRDIHEPAVDLVTADGWVASQSHYSLVSGALSMAAFLELDQAEAWLCAMPLWTWEGLYSALVALYLGGAAVVCGPDGATDEVADLIDDHSVAYALAPFEILRNLSRGRPRRLAASLKRNLDGLMLSTDRPFAAIDRRKARKALDVPILTVFGLTETGPILASHPSWYVDESVGIPVTNVEVQPVNPETGEPLDTNWELLDYARMVIRAPQLMAGYEGPAAEDERLSSRLEDGWFKTGALASFDANGMMYLVEG